MKSDVAWLTIDHNKKHHASVGFRPDRATVKGSRTTRLAPRDDLD